MGWDGVGRLTLVSVNRRLASGQIDLVECGIGLPVIDGDDHRAGGVGYVPHLARAASLSGCNFPDVQPVGHVVVVICEAEPCVGVYVVFLTGEKELTEFGGRLHSPANFHVLTAGKGTEG